MSYEEISILECAQKTQIIGELTPKLTYYSKVLKQPEAVPLIVIAKDYEIRIEERAELPSDEERKKWIFTKRGDDEE